MEFTNNDSDQAVLKTLGQRLEQHRLNKNLTQRQLAREAGMSLEAIQAQAGHRSIESTRIYLHLANDWLANEYLRASDVIDAGRFADDVVAVSEGLS